MSVTDLTPYIEFHDSIYDNPKTFALAQLLGQDTNFIAGMLPRLWIWSQRRGSPSVNLSPFALAEVMHWDKDPQILQDALIACRWLDRSDDSVLTVHDWDNFIGDSLLRQEHRRQQNREKQARYRASLTTDHLLPRNVTALSPVTLPSTNLPVTTKTKQNKTKQNIKSICTQKLSKEPSQLKQKYGTELPNVLLSTEEHEKLVKRFGEQDTSALIDDLSLAKAGRGYKSKSDYYTILNWARRKAQGGGNGQHQAHSGQTPSPVRGLSIPQRYTRPEELGPGAGDKPGS